ncbi:hypothetical protein [Bacteroides pyogenes]|jgi:hypothetical protein|uniref:Bacterial repeat domain-containing protein n=1 Tax=Bacteroides pyogenes TaxID=310300 RepID=A0A5D3EAH1_9BACE|nr:hypothetical protein [Bacteroides pyogenes]TYK32849.1 hypothetical protein FNJ60_10590 [Bacteroides pyogenes]
MKVIVYIIGFLCLSFLFFACGEDSLNRDKKEKNLIKISTEVSIDGEDVSSTRASSVAGYTSGDGLYHQGEPFTVTAHANQGYELIRFYERTTNDKKFTGKSSYEGEASIDLVFKAEMARLYEITTVALSVRPGERIFYLSSPIPVSKEICSRIKIREEIWRQDYEDSPDELIYQEEYFISLIIPVGAKVSNKETIESTVSGNNKQISILSIEHGWNGKLLNGGIYRLKNNAWFID